MHFPLPPPPLCWILSTFPIIPLSPRRLSPSPLVPLSPCRWDKTDWIRLTRATYDASLDQRDYRPKTKP